MTESKEVDYYAVFNILGSKHGQMFISTDAIPLFGDGRDPKVVEKYEEFADKYFPATSAQLDQIVNFLKEGHGVRDRSLSLDQISIVNYALDGYLNSHPMLAVAVAKES